MKLASPAAVPLAAIVAHPGLGVPVSAAHHDAEGLTLICGGGEVLFD